MELYSISKLLIILDGLVYLTYFIAIENRHCRTPPPPPPRGYTLQRTIQRGSAQKGSLFQARGLKKGRDFKS